MPVALAAASLVVAVPAFGNAEGAAARGPDMVVGALTSKGALRALGATHISVTVKNLGKTTARTPKITVLLSKDRRRNGADRVIGSASPKKLRAGKKTVVSVSGIVPSKLGAGSYYMLACAATGKQKQASTRNDCMTARRRVAVKAAATPIIPQIATLESAAVTKTFGSAGGTVAITLPDGTGATLTVPAKSLVNATAIRLVPVPAVAPGPAGVQPVAALLIEPETLMVPRATLKFTPSAVLARAKLLGVAFGGEDESIVAKPFLPRSGKTLDVSVFGGYGIGIKTGRSVSSAVVTTANAIGAACRLSPAGLEAVDPCHAESLRKRLDAILSGVNYDNPAEVASAYEAADTFIDKEVDPAIDRAVNDGAVADEVDPYIALVLGLERQEQLLGINPDGHSKGLAKLLAIMEKIANNSLKRCESRTQGPLTTVTQIRSIQRQAQLLGKDLSHLDGAFNTRCASKPWLLDYNMTVGEASTVSLPPPIFAAGTIDVAGLELPVPQLPAGTPTDGQKAGAYSGLSCSPGIFVSCSVTAASGSLKVQYLRGESKTKDQTRCNRTVKVHYWVVVLRFTMVDDSQTLHVIPMMPLLPFDLPNSGTFQRGIDIGTEGEIGEVPLPDNGGLKDMIGSTGNFHGSGISVDDHGFALLKLK